MFKILVSNFTHTANNYYTLIVVVSDLSHLPLYESLITPIYQTSGIISDFNTYLKSFSRRIFFIIMVKIRLIYLLISQI